MSEDTNVLLSGMKGLGAEVAKNIIQAGVKSVMIHDPDTIKMEHLPSQFFTDKDIGKNCAEVCHPQLAELNSYVRVDIHRGELSQDILKRHQVMVLTQSRFDGAKRIGDICHNHGIRFFMANARGMFGLVFSSGTLHCVNHVCTPGLRPDSKKISDSFTNPEFIDTEHEHSPQLHVAFLALDKFYSEMGHMPREHDAAKFVEIAKQQAIYGDYKLEKVDTELMTKFSNAPHDCDSHRMHSDIGSIVAQEITQAGGTGKFSHRKQWLYLYRSQQTVANP